MYILDKEATKPLYIQLYEAMKEEILNTLSSRSKTSLGTQSCNRVHTQ